MGSSIGYHTAMSCMCIILIFFLCIGTILLCFVWIPYCYVLYVYHTAMFCMDTILLCFVWIPHCYVLCGYHTAMFCVGTILLFCVGTILLCFVWVPYCYSIWHSQCAFLPLANDMGVYLSRNWKLFQCYYKLFCHLCCFLHNLINVIIKTQLCVYSDPYVFAFQLCRAGTWCCLVS